MGEGCYVHPTIIDVGGNDANSGPYSIARRPAIRPQPIQA